jgi:hypothetical protein
LFRTGEIDPGRLSKVLVGLKTSKIGSGRFSLALGVAPKNLFFNRSTDINLAAFASYEQTEKLLGFKIINFSYQ